MDCGRISWFNVRDIDQAIDLIIYCGLNHLNQRISTTPHKDFVGILHQCAVISERIFSQRHILDLAHGEALPENVHHLLTRSI